MNIHVQPAKGYLARAIDYGLSTTGPAGCHSCREGIWKYRSSSWMEMREEYDCLKGDIKRKNSRNTRVSTLFSLEKYTYVADLCLA